MKYFKYRRNVKYLIGCVISLMIIFILTSCTTPQGVVREEPDKIVTKHAPEPNVQPTYEKPVPEAEPDFQMKPEQAEDEPPVMASVTKSTDPSGTMEQLAKEISNALDDSPMALIQQDGDSLTVVLNSDALFDGRSSALRPGVSDRLGGIAKIMAQHSQLSFRVEGHTDSTGADIYNMKLSEKRAEAVKKVLIQNGCGESQIKTLAFGESKPADSNQTLTGRQKNRRIEIRITN